MTKDNKKDKQTKMTDEELNQLSIKIVSRMMNIQTMSEWYEHVSSSDIAMSIMNTEPINGWEIEPLTHKHSDLEYIYYIWQKPNDSTWISIFEVGTNAHYCNECGHYLEPQLGEDKCIFVGEPQKLIEKYKLNTDNDR